MRVPSAPPDCARCSSATAALRSCAVPARGRTATLAAGGFAPILRLTSWPLINAYNRINLPRRARTGQSGRETVHGQDEK